MRAIIMTANHLMHACSHDFDRLPHAYRPKGHPSHIETEKERKDRMSRMGPGMGGGGFMGMDPDATPIPRKGFGALTAARNTAGLDAAPETTPAAFGQWRDESTAYERTKEAERLFPGEFPEGVPDMDEMMKDLPNEYLPEMDADGNFPKEEIKKKSKSREKDEV